MLSYDTIKKISTVFCGDDKGYYSYKSDPALVAFFNTFSGNQDIYHQGFPSRWQYVLTNLEDIISNGQFDIFLTHILSKRYLMNDLDCNEVDAVHKSREIHQHLDNLVKADACLILKRNNQFSLIRESDDLLFIKSGGFADVYAQRSTGRIVKKLKDDLITNAGIRSRFKREYSITKSLGDIPGVVEVFGFSEDTCSYTMEMADNTLDNYIRNNTLSEEAKINYIRQVLSIMKDVHNRDVIHRDISPNNIFIIKGLLKIADFGLGKDLHALNSHQTQHTAMFGQYIFCAPEQYSQLKEGDKRSDVFSLGRLINFIMTIDPINANHLFKVVTDKATQTDPNHRQEDATTLLSSFEKCMEFIQQKETRDIFLKKINEGLFDDIVEMCVFEQTGEEICKGIINKDSRVILAYEKFIHISASHASHMLNAIFDYVNNAYINFNDYDPISDFVYDIVISNLEHSTIESAAKILVYNAVDVNRYHAQRLIDIALKKDISPHIAEILRNNTK